MEFSPPLGCDTPSASNGLEVVITQRDDSLLTDDLAGRAPLLLKGTAGPTQKPGGVQDILPVVHSLLYADGVLHQLLGVSCQLGVNSQLLRSLVLLAQCRIQLKHRRDGKLPEQALRQLLELGQQLPQLQLAAVDIRLLFFIRIRQRACHHLRNEVAGVPTFDCIGGLRSSLLRLV